MPPVLFLDIDGVLNTPESCGKYHSNEVFLPSAVMALRKIVQTTACQIIISSSWRMDDQRQRIRPVFAQNGLAEVLAGLQGVTPDYSAEPGTTREDEIAAWLEQNRPDAGFAFAILDDDTSQFTGPLRQRLVWVDDRYGLTDENANRCVELLQSQ